jgi:hypothetical protein
MSTLLGQASCPNSISGGCPMNGQWFKIKKLKMWWYLLILFIIINQQPQIIYGFCNIVNSTTIDQCDVFISWRFSIYFLYSWWLQRAGRVYLDPLEVFIFYWCCQFHYIAPLCPALTPFYYSTTTEQQHFITPQQTFIEKIEKLQPNLLKTVGN